jgi:hypothetical protein
MNHNSINPDDILKRAISVRAAALGEEPGAMDDKACERLERTCSDEDWAVMVSLLLVDFGGARTQREASPMVARMPAFLKKARTEYRPGHVAAYIAECRRASWVPGDEAA